jgi:prepilin-type N-terminal cleavage/methylation domain-containing protein
MGSVMLRKLLKAVMNHAGFTLIEVMILILLAGWALPGANRCPVTRKGGVC